MKSDGQERRAQIEREIPVGSTWLHYKGGTYGVVAVSCKEDEPGVILITYVSHLLGSIWTRTAENFRDSWQTPVGRVERFKRVETDVRELRKQIFAEAAELCVNHGRSFPHERDDVESVALHLARLLRAKAEELDK